MEISTVSTRKLKELAQKVAKAVNSGGVIALYGKLGAGKTTFTRYLVEVLGSEARVQSPTFVISRHYSVGGSKLKNINHVDLYRLTTIDEVEDIGLDEIISEKNSLTIIEWPEIYEDKLPNDCIKIKFEYTDNENERRITIQNLP